MVYAYARVSVNYATVRSTSGKSIAGPFEGHTDQINSVACAPNGKHIVSGSCDNTVCVWDVKSGNVVAGPFEGHSDAVMSVAFSPDGRQVAFGSGDLTIRIWTFEAEPLEQPSGNPRATNETSLATLPDGNFGSNWTMSEDGWILGKGGELLTWIPPDLRQTLLPPYCKTVFGWQFATRLDLAASPLGENWTRGY
ncbi:WD40 repeat-like protein [Fomitiporia mediterranea MF3/22]|uniref:WD40 repeat-like protein n=1 Tax=Fomitiporia mediterranea (strain MF3/22) TaxID=694068 RepID=R7SG52_FOMME|nr:WD40 repeat-like protein [Fomitiporia mediterranea MF3/22]EJC97693.1 WD40 repeat-like protein [Fomitiporia mediterranea MF3/22]